MMGLLDTQGRPKRGLVIALGLVALAVIGIVDYLTGFEIMFSVFYLLVVGLVT
ncbi:MAG TPA: hypothetical protein VMU04_04380 [Candidatus Acidoferrum sp.]|nr:hypothetical protein [Candidatus Acidoferrum sp.]